VPEIYDGTVMIRGAVREAGDRAKVAVMSRERDVDPVGACVGMKGTRVQSIIRELRGEKIDIVEWSEDPVAFVTNGLSPAKVQRVSIVDDRERVMEVIVEDKQLSLAIGKKGQNVRLAAKLTGWRIDIKSEEEKRREVEAQFGELEMPAGDESEDQSADLSAEADGAGMSAEAEAGDESPAKADLSADLSTEADEASAKVEAADGESTAAKAEAGDEASAKVEAEEAGTSANADLAESPVPYTLPGIGEKTVRKLVDGGFATLESLATATADVLSELPGIGGKTAEKILAAVRGEEAQAEGDI
jgi:N utilization substance protein A